LRRIIRLARVAMTRSGNIAFEWPTEKSALSVRRAKPFFGLWMLLCAAQAQGFDTAAPDFGSTVVGIDWVAGCDNMGNCSAASLPVRNASMEFDVEKTIEIKVEIDNRVDRPATVELSTTIDTAIRWRYKDRKIAVDGKILPIDIYWRDGTIRLEGSDADLLIRRMKGARQLRLVERDKAIAEASIEGFSAVLEHIRTRQGRKAEQPQPPIKLPSRDRWIAGSIRSEQLEALAQTDECRRYSKAHRAIEQIQYHRLDAEHTLAIAEVACANYAGQNEPSHIFVVGDDKMKWAYPAMFEPHPLDNVSLGPNYLPNVRWDQHYQTLHAFQKMAGSGYCGAHATFAWDGEIFRLVEYRFMPVCRGSTNFITTYRRATERAPWQPVPVVPMTIPAERKGD
jgi:Protein of unknown function (DUF1176)